MYGAGSPATDGPSVSSRNERSIFWPHLSSAKHYSRQLVHLNGPSPTLVWDHVYNPKTIFSIHFPFFWISAFLCFFNSGPISIWPRPFHSPCVNWSSQFFLILALLKLLFLPTKTPAQPNTVWPSVFLAQYMHSTNIYIQSPQKKKHIHSVQQCNTVHRDSVQYKISES